MILFPSSSSRGPTALLILVVGALLLLFAALSAAAAAPGPRVAPAPPDGVPHGAAGGAGTAGTASEAGAEAQTEAESSALRVAVIGSGIGGSSTAHFVRQLLPDARVTVFEAAQRVGGRMRSTDAVSPEGPAGEEGGEGAGVGLGVGGAGPQPRRRYNSGAGIFLRSNRYVASFADALGLNATRPHHGGRRRLGVWDSRVGEFVFEEHWLSAVTAARSILRYGPLNFFLLRGRVEGTVRKWERVYELQEQGRSFDSPRELLEELGLYELSQRTMREELAGSWIDGSLLVRELGAGVAAVNYNQNLLDMNALVAYIAMAPLVLSPEVLHVPAGNERICEGLLREAGARVHLGRRVSRLVRVPAAGGAGRGGWSVEVEVGPSSLPAGVFDYVVVAAPWAQADLRVDDGTGWRPSDVVREADYLAVSATFVRGLLNPGFFGRRSHDDMPDQLFFPPPEGVPSPPVNFVGTQDSDLPGGERVYKTFSTSPVSERDLRLLFHRRSAVYEERFERAYPVYSGGARLPPTALRPGLYFASSLEGAASAMEIMAVAARNVALMIARDAGRNSPAPPRGDLPKESGSPAGGKEL